MRSKLRTALVLALTGVLAASLAVAPVQAEEEVLAPTDYIELADTLSQPVYPETVTEVVTIPAYDGAELYLEITKPDPAVYEDEGPWPVILEASPYHGTIATRIGDRMFPDPKDDEGNNLGLTGYFAPRGYAVAMFDLRGTGRSEGCLDHLGPNDAEDLTTVIEWLADQDWSNGKVGMTGHSYVGSTPSAAAAQQPRGLATVMPSAGLASMYDHQFQKGVPWLLQWIGPMVAYPSLATERDLPPEAPGLPVLGGGVTGDNFDNAPNPEFGCGWQNSAAISGTGQLTGQYQLWHAQRDHRAGAAEADIPTFMIHGVHDNAARIPAAEWFFGGRFDRGQDKVWIGQWDHGSTNGRCGDPDGNRVLHPTCRFEQMQYAIHAWFDKHLNDMDVDTGPAVEAFLNGETPQSLTQVRDPEDWGTKVLVDDAWKRPQAWTNLHLDADNMSLDFAPPSDDASESFAGGVNAVLAHAGADSIEFESAPFEEDTVFLGLPRLTLNASVTNQIVHLIATLHREDAAGNREPLTTCAIQPQLRHGVHDIAPVVPGQEMSLPLQCFTAAGWVPAGQHLVLEVGTTSPHHASFGFDPQITIHTGPGKGGLRLPTVPDAVLHDDVPLREGATEDPDQGEFPLGPAQAPIDGEVIVGAPGAGTRLAPVTSETFEFEVEDGFDNAAIEILATPQLPADLDLYLQRAEGDGWSGDLARAETGALDHELLTHGRLVPGLYRVEVHNWVGPPTPVDLRITFSNQAGEPGS